MIKNVQIMSVDEQNVVLMLMNYSWHILYQTNRVHQFLDKGNGLVAERHLPKGSIVFTEVCVCVCVCVRWRVIRVENACAWQMELCPLLF